jgi:hypothetical protein
MTDTAVEPLGSSTPKYALRYPAATDPADVPTDMQNLALDVEAALGVALPTPSTSPPPGAVDGQLWGFRPVPSIYWLFRYNPSSPRAEKWECVGGVPVIPAVPGNTAPIPTGAWVDSGGPTFAAARAGIYQVGFNALATMPTPPTPAGAIIDARVAIATGADATPIDGTAAIVQSTAGGLVTLSKPVWTVQASAGSTIKLVYLVNGPTSDVSFGYRFMSVLALAVN